MQMNARNSTKVVSGAVRVWVLLSAMSCLAAGPVEPGRAVLDKLLKAVEANRYDSFVADGTDVFKAAMTKQMLEGVSGQLSTRMKRGYDCTYLGELRQHGCQVLLW